MAGRIPENLLEDILGRVDIVEMISGYIQLKKAGANFKANCPFHHEKTASFMVSPGRQIYHCFGCGESGNAFKFLMRHERMEFPEAVEMLAKKCGVTLPDQDAPESARAASLSSQLYKVNELAVSFYENNLHTGSATAAIDYLSRRGIKLATVKEFCLGLATSGWDNLINFLRSKNVTLALMEQAGLILPKDQGGYYDRFRNRIIFPVFDLRSRLIGFGARVMDNSLPKYINSPETPVYTKGKNLFGFNLSKDFIRDADSAVIVEGYLDFMIPYQEGLKNIVASQGTALTLEQIKLLKRYTHNVVMIYDGDTAGEIATLRSLDILIDEGINVKVVPLPKGIDPDALVRNEGINALKTKVQKAASFFDYKLDVLKSRHDIKDEHGKTKIASEMLSTINKFDNAILRGEYTKRLAEEMRIPEQYILEELHKLKPAASTSIGQPAPLGRKNLEINPAEKLLIKFMLEEKELIEKIMQQLSPADFADARTAKIVSVMQDLVGQGKNITPSVLMNYFSEDDASQLVCETMFMPALNEQEREKAVNDCIARIKVQRIKSRREHLHLEIKSAQSLGDEGKLNSLIQEFHNLIKKGD
ncbi:MAG: DNA primase [Candidatus Omnitrophica bacterium]|nr:DNA primase [Candidatus Omnitrophota bacterium]MBU4303412.1 DNA primase [Candidatus Omnitrophota bacterium]MBU4419301.1 DNA primase [Candidatus Omnitrophota bacterium]MBU4468798.1 DNA primase [Candidatus Omnitrophota bacterium]MCG2708085.1 DNA primase [Candidatus Omnitrophota bacterium]